MSLRLFKVLSVISLLLVLFSVSAEEMEEDYDQETAENAADEGQLYYCQAFFPNQTTPTFPTGSLTHTIIGYQNNDKSVTQAVVLVAAYLQPKGTYSTTLQNFSVVRQARTVRPKESVSFQYSFTPDVYFEPGMYNLVIGLYVQDTSTNTTNFVVGYNNTITLREPLGTDPRTILTYLTLLALIAAAGFFMRQKLMSNKPSVPKHTPSAKQPQGDSYDPDYIGAEHLRYKEELSRRKNTASPKGRK